MRSDAAKNWKHSRLNLRPGKRNLFGIQVISEPHLHTDEGHAFLESYYQQAIMAAREFLDPSIPIVLFEWTYEMCKWDDNAFPESIYGKATWPPDQLGSVEYMGLSWFVQITGTPKKLVVFSYDKCYYWMVRRHSRTSPYEPIAACKSFAT